MFKVDHQRATNVYTVNALHNVNHMDPCTQTCDDVRNADQQYLGLRKILQSNRSDAPWWSRLVHFQTFVIILKTCLQSLMLY